MRRTLAVFLITALAPVPALPAITPVKDWKDVRKPELRPFQPVSPRRVVLGNGLVMFLQEDKELPLVQATLRIRGGSREEDATKTGMVSIYGQAWRAGGTRKRSGDHLDDYLEARGARVETGGGLDSTSVSLNCLKDNFGEVFDVFMELLKEPEFRQDKIDIAKRQLSTGIARRNDDPQSIAFREAEKLGYGPDSPYARVVEYATIAAVTREDLLAWHKKTLYADQMVFGIVGDFDAKAMEAQLRKALETLPRGGTRPKPAPVAADATRPGYYFVQKDDVNQANIRMVHVGTTVDNPDYYALTMMNEIWGGAFSGRLFSSIRSKKGLAYTVRGSVGTEYDHPGLLVLSTSTKSETTAAAIEALYEGIDNLKKVPPTADEMTRARDSILNSFVFQFDSRAKVLFQKMTYEFYGYPLDFLERYRAGIEKVTAADVSRVASQYVHRDKLAVLVVGKAADFDKPLTSFGTVTPVDITIPAPPSAAK